MTDLEMLFRDYEAITKAIAAQLRQALAAANVPRMDFEVSIEGRTHGGDLEVIYKIGEYGTEVNGRDIHALLNEYLRRRGWDNDNRPLCLPHSSSDLEF